MAKPRIPFSQLKPATKQRKIAYYAKHQGLTAKQVAGRYNAGTLGPQSAARGHPNGDEYRARKKKAIDFIYEFKKGKWSHRPKWNAARAKKAISHDPETGKERGIKALKIIENMVKLAIADELYNWHDIVALDYDYESAFYYHLREGYRMNYEELARVAMAFILEDEVWDEFLAWAIAQPHSPEMHAWIITADKTEIRREWMRNSGNPFLVAMAESL